MVFVVRRDLQWSKQKLAVMTAHAALALFKKLYKGRNPVLMQWVSVHTHVCKGGGGGVDGGPHIGTCTSGPVQEAVQGHQG